MKAINVSFPSGRELLNAYWGLLANGGLVLGEQQSPELREGDTVALEVTIESSHQRYHLNGHVVRRPASGRERVVIAFEPGEPHDLLLSAAWAETDNVPARRQRRFPIDAAIRFRAPTDEGPRPGRLVNLSLGGCCLRVPRADNPLEIGQPLTLLGDKGQLVGVVRWSTGSCRGIEFENADSATVERFVKQFI